MGHFNRRVVIAFLAALAVAGCTRAEEQPFADGTIVVLGGDTHFGENYATRNPVGAVIDGPPADYARGFAKLKPLLERGVFSLVNLETPLSGELSDASMKKDYVHWTDPERAAPGLAAAGIDAVGLANNHTLDQGASGLRKTLAVLDQNHIASFGAGTSINSARAPLLHQIRLPGGGLRTLAVFGMFEIRPSYRDKLDFYAGKQKLGVAPLDIAAFAQQVIELRRSDPHAFVIAFPHWGRNYDWANDEQVRLGRALVDAGADIVVGQHAHTLQEVEQYHDKWILYGIGNFLFNAPGRYSKYPKVKPFGLVVELSFGKDAASAPQIRLHPFLSDNHLTGYVPRPASSEEARQIMSALQSRKRSIGFAGELVENDPAGPAIQLGARHQWWQR